MTLRPGWRESLRRALGDRRTVTMGLLLIALGVFGKLALLEYANIETVFVAALLAGSLLGRLWAALVPLSILAILQPILWGTEYSGYAAQAILGITFFIATGFLFVGIVGRRMRRRVLFRVRSVALLTTVSVPLTIAYDLWTDVGVWYFLFRPHGIDFLTVLQLQVPFTLYHLLSSLIFVPLFGTAFLFLHAHSWRMDAPETVPSEPSEPR